MSKTYTMFPNRKVERLTYPEIACLCSKQKNI
nr:MAG TPA: hypothetical protein [Caudoviricetes sp.]